VAVTFDDGYRDNFTCAFPILKQFGIPATIYLATGYIGSGQMPWYDRVRLAFKLTTHSRFSMSELGGPSGKLDEIASRLRTMEQTLSWLRSIADSERQSSLTQVCQNLGVPCDLNLPNQMLRWEDIRLMTSDNINFGAHTVMHPVLSRIPASELKREVEGSKRMIENKLQLPVTHFAYPFGQSQDFNALAKDAVRTAGFKTAVTAIWGLNEPKDDPLELKRFTPWETDSAEFKLKLDWFRFRAPHAGKTQTPEQISASAMAREAHL
jgi:peptidoglycan/xylan/chitin deacetylase (PgdA/CDA1 family)